MIHGDDPLAVVGLRDRAPLRRTAHHPRGRGLPSGPGCRDQGPELAPRDQRGRVADPHRGDDPRPLHRERGRGTPRADPGGEERDPRAVCLHGRGRGPGHPGGLDRGGRADGHRLLVRGIRQGAGPGGLRRLGRRRSDSACSSGPAPKPRRGAGRSGSVTPRASRNRSGDSSAWTAARSSAMASWSWSTSRPNRDTRFISRRPPYAPMRCCPGRPTPGTLPVARGPAIGRARATGTTCGASPGSCSPRRGPGVAGRADRPGVVADAHDRGRSLGEPISFRIDPSAESLSARPPDFTITNAGPRTIGAEPGRVGPLRPWSSAQETHAIGRHATTGVARRPVPVMPCRLGAVLLRRRAGAGSTGRSDCGGSGWRRGPGRPST